MSSSDYFVYKRYIGRLKNLRNRLSSKKSKATSKVTPLKTHDYSGGRFAGSKYNKFESKQEQIISKGSKSLNSTFQENLSAIDRKISYYKSEIRKLKLEYPELAMFQD